MPSGALLPVPLRFEDRPVVDFSGALGISGSEGGNLDCEVL